MPEYKFTSNIKCSNCEASVREVLDTKESLKSFKVDLQDPSRSVKIEVEAGTSEAEVKSWVQEAGFELKSSSSFLKKLFK